MKNRTDNENNGQMVMEAVVRGGQAEVNEAEGGRRHRWNNQAGGENMMTKQNSNGIKYGNQQKSEA